MSNEDLVDFKYLNDINKIIEGLEPKAQRCRNTLKILRDRLSLKTATM